MKKTVFYDKYIDKIERGHMSLRVNKRRKDLKVNALDTETLNGYCRLLLYTNGDNNLCYEYVNDLDSILKILNAKKFRSSINFFYNINFDFRALFKFLGEKGLKKGIKHNEFQYDKYKVKFFNNKFFSVNRNKFFDLCQFYKMKLDIASKKYLGENKVDIPTFWYDNINKFYSKEFLDYGLKDIELTQRLGYLFHDMLNNMKMYCYKPFSVGSLGEHYICSNVIVPHLPFNVRIYAENFYKGGWFELFRKGYFENVYQFDLNSAYPYQISKLKNLGEWLNTNDLDELLNHPFSILKCKISQEDNIFNPIQLKRKDNNISYHPNFKDKIIYILPEEYNFYKKYIDIDCYDGWINFNKDSFMFPSMKNLYNMRLKMKREGDKRELIVKLILNSMYGKFYQKINKNL